jgi:hypothetical protein
MFTRELTRNALKTGENPGDSDRGDNRSKS